MSDKFERSGLTATKSQKIDAPIIEEFPLTLECKVVEDKTEIYGHHVLGEIIGVLADEAVVDEKGRVDPSKLNALSSTNFKAVIMRLAKKSVLLGRAVLI